MEYIDYNQTNNNIEKCGKCGIQGRYDIYHRMHAPCRVCAKKLSLE